MAWLSEIKFGRTPEESAWIKHVVGGVVDQIQQRETLHKTENVADKIKTED